MVRVLAVRFHNELHPETWQRLLNPLPLPLQQKASRYIRWQDRTASLLGRYLLLEALRPYGFNADCLHHLRYSSYKRPFLDWPGDFNLSHSGTWVVCAVVPEGQVGIDVEKYRDLSFNDFRRCFTQREWAVIDHSEDPLSAFFRYWAAKESVIKADGRGLYAPLQSIEVGANFATSDQGEWHLQPVTLDDGYACCLATSQPVSGVSLQEIPLEQLA